MLVAGRAGLCHCDALSLNGGLTDQFKLAVVAEDDILVAANDHVKLISFQVVGQLGFRRIFFYFGNLASCDSSVSCRLGPENPSYPFRAKRDGHLTKHQSPPILQIQFELLISSQGKSAPKRPDTSPSGWTPGWQRSSIVLMGKQQLPPPMDRRQEPPLARHGQRSLPKPAWREMVEPYLATVRGATIRNHLDHAPGWVWVSGEGCKCPLRAVPLALYIERYGPDITFPELSHRMRCGTCKAMASFTLPSFGRNNEHRFPPIDRVPAHLRGYAKIDPVYVPAPLRGNHVR